MLMASSTDKDKSPQLSRGSYRNGETITSLTQPFQYLHVTGDNNDINSMMEGLAKKLMHTLNVSCSSKTECEKKLADVMSDLKNAGISDINHEENLKSVTNDL